MEQYIVLDSSEELGCTAVNALENAVKTRSLLLATEGAKYE
jgi:hypothetical protein